MALEERRAWIAGVVALLGYGGYLVALLVGGDGRSLAERPYAAALLWSIGAAVVVTVLLSVAAAAIRPEEGAAKDLRDRQIHRFGEHVGQSFVVIGAVAALLLALAEAAPFWIANAVYLAFVLSAVLGAMAKVAAYRRGLPQW
ncbi:hypothetical protein ACIRBX_15035 [Kitasatospora sp. NPDC096147]|uniref:hypothetical protein n=1 Tax=Kitasatospora sp. NPDC096147 TaxID=3364093 RepID=UPI003802993C